MKKQILFLSIGLLALASCKNDTTSNLDSCCKAKTNDLIQKDVSIITNYDLYTNDQNSEMFTEINQIEFLNKLYTKAGSGHIKSYSPFTTQELSPQAVQEFFVGIPDAAAPYPKEEIKSLIFDEEWVLDTAAFTMSKRVKNYTLVREYFKTDNDGAKVLNKTLVATYDFSNDTVKDLKDLTLLAKDVAYEVSFEEFGITGSLANFPIQHAREVITKKMLANTEQAYDFYKFTSKLDSVSPSEVQRRLGYQEYYTQYENEDGTIDSVFEVTNVDFTEISGFAFVEDWYIDESTMQIVKDIKAIAPVRDFYKMYGEGMIDRTKTIPFLMFFSNHKQK